MVDGPYIVLPIIGPSNLRDVLGRTVDYFMDPFNYYARVKWGRKYIYLRFVATILSSRAAHLQDIKTLRETSLDFYATVRSLYGQYRQDHPGDIIPQHTIQHHGGSYGTQGYGGGIGGNGHGGIINHGGNNNNTLTQLASVGATAARNRKASDSSLPPMDRANWKYGVDHLSNKPGGGRGRGRGRSEPNRGGLKGNSAHPPHFALDLDASLE